MKTQIAILTLAIFSFVSCNSTKNNMDTGKMIKSEITDTKWELNTLEGALIEATTNMGKSIHFTLNSSTNSISGYSGCNTFNGTYVIEEGNRIKFSKIASTRMSCPDSDFKENELLEVFNLADNYVMSNGMLMLNVGRRAPLAIFKKSNDNPIVEKYWKLKTLEGKPVTMGENQEREIFFMLKTDDNRVTGFAGCNSLGGSYTLESGNRIRFKNMAVTMMMCEDLPVKESDFLEVFELADNYRINGDILNLNVGRRAPLAVFEAVYF